MPYTATDDLNDLDETLPPSSGQVNTDLGPAALETRRTFKAVILKEHNPDGTHTSVNGSALTDGTVPAAKLVAASLTATQMADGAITTNKLADGAVTAVKITDATITGAKVTAKTLAAAKMLSTAGGKIWVGDGSGGMAEVSMSGAATISAAGVVTLAASVVGQAIAIFADIETSGTDGGTFTSGAWQTRALNSTVVDTGMLFNLSANVLTLATAGTYYIKAAAVGYKVDGHQIRLWDTTNNAVLADGMPTFADASVASQTESTLETVITLAAGVTLTMKLQHRCATTSATSGFGKNTGFGDNNVFAIITIVKLA